jgi:cation diffusion facilitator family transporter
MAAEKATLTSIYVTTIVGAIELPIGILFGSLAFIAAGVDALSDTVTSIGVLLGLRISKRPADENHPYGHGQVETVVSLVLAIMLVAAGLRIAYEAIQKLFVSSSASAPLELFLISGFSALILFALGKYKISVGRKSRAISLVADGYETISNSLSNVAVLVGLIFVCSGFALADPLVGLGISALIVFWGARISKESLSILMETAPEREVMDKIEEVCTKVPGVADFHKCRARKIGSNIFADLHVLVDEDINVKRAHEIATEVERRLKAEIEDLESVVVHVEPKKVK